MNKLKFKYILIIIIIIIIIILILIYIFCNYFLTKEFIPYDKDKLNKIKKNQQLNMYVPLNILHFSQSNISNKMNNNEDLFLYSKKIKENYLKTNKISFLQRNPPKAIFWEKTNKLQLLDNRRAVAAIKIFCKNCEYTNELPNNIFIPVRILHPDTLLEKNFKNRFNQKKCFLSTKELCKSLGKNNKPNTFGEAVLFRSKNSIDYYNLNTNTTKIPKILNSSLHDL
jgi:hypothetical protein